MTSFEIAGRAAELELRPMVPQDLQLRTEATLRNVNRTGERIGPGDLSQEPWSRYLNFDPERGDHGFVASIGGEPVGVIWAIFDRAYGFVAAEIPELVISVRTQGQGIGTELLKQLIAHARTEHWPGVSLSVEAGNPAQQLYRRHGFAAVDRAQPGTMLLDFGSAAARDLDQRAGKITAVAVYCGSRSGVNTEYQAAASALGRELAGRGIRLVYGGGNVGLMGEVANAAVTAGGEVVGVIPQALVNREMAHHELTRLEVVDTMAQRKTRMEELADAFVVLPGGAGTLEEAFEVLTMQQLGEISGPLALLNTASFWDPLVEMLGRMSEEGFLRRKFLDALVVADSPAELFSGFADWRDPGDKWE